MRRSKVLALAFTLCLCAGGSAFGAEAGWVNQPGGWLYQDENGDAVKNNWREIDGKWYHFDEAGMMNTGWFEDCLLYTSPGSDSHGLQHAKPLGLVRVAEENAQCNRFTVLGRTQGGLT